jgi:hypothetical protein
MSDMFTFTITNATEREEWSPQRISKLLAAIAIMSDGLAVASTGDDYFDRLVRESPQLASLAEFQTALRYLEHQAHSPHEEAADLEGQLLARGYLHMNPGEEWVTLTSLSKGSIEGVITDFGKAIASGIGWIFSMALDPTVFSERVGVSFRQRPHGRNEHVAMGAIFEARRMVAEAADSDKAKIVVSPPFQSPPHGAIEA